MVSKALFSSETHTWSTPDNLYNGIDKKCKFAIDLAANASNTKHKRWFGPDSKYAEDSLRVKWHKIKGWCWLNPPYGRELHTWMQKCHKEAQKGAKIMALVPARTDTKWFHDFIYKKYDVIFIKGRLKFGGAKNSAPFPSMLVVFRKKARLSVSNMEIVTDVKKIKATRPGKNRIA
jgi:phage N-6-adenine-methyltransferase